MRRLTSAQCLRVALLTTLLLVALEGQSLSLVSSSNIVGQSSVNYTFVLTNISAVSSVVFSFQSWAPLSVSPFVGGTKCYLGSTLLTCTSFPSQIQCGLTLTGSAQSFNLTLTSMTNPSSTKPYLVNLTLTNSTASLLLSASLTMSNLQNFPLSVSGYSRSIGTSSSGISIDMTMNNYIDSTTFLSLTYNRSLIAITFPNTSAYTVLQNSNGSVLISNWNSLSAGKVTLTAISIVNPQAAITYSITGLFYFKSGNITYNVQTLSTTLTLSAAAFTTLTIGSPLPYGSLTAITVSSACNFTQVGNSSNQSYTIVDFSTELQPTNTSDCTITSNSTCQHAKSGTYSLSNFRVGIGSYTSASLTFTSYTFYANAFYALCKATASLTLSQQSIAPFTVGSECDTNVSSLSNTISLYSNVQSLAAGDMVYVSGLKGVITNNNTWSSLTINSTVWYTTTLISSQITANGSTSTLTLPLTYNNPNETTLNSISTFTIYRNATQYAAMSNSTSLTLCSITAARPIASYSIVPTSLNTYEVLNISVAFSMQIYDYAYNDYLDLQINSSGLAKQYFFAGSLISLTPNLTVNGVYCTFSLLNDYTVRIVLGKNVSLPSSSSPTLTISLINLVNGPAVDSYWFSLTTWDQPTGGSKETLSSSSSFTLRTAALTTSTLQLYLLANNSISISLSNSNRAILSKNNASASTTLTLTLPSAITCSNFTNSSRSSSWNVGIATSTSFATGNTTNIILSLGTCLVSYFSTASMTVSESFNGAQSTSTTISVTNKCGSCYQCSTSSCTACFNNTYSSLIYYYSNQCYSGCPNHTYTSNISCLDCHSSCLTCTGPLFTQCTACSSNFTLSSGYCSSVCGAGKYESNGDCISCHPNCQSCVSYSVCYVCKTGAVLIGGVCQFSSCTSPCLSCEGSLTTCTACVSSYYLYGSQCYSSCPTGTYPKGTLCSSVSESSAYVPVTIAGAVCMLFLVLLRVYSSKKVGKRKEYEQDGQDGQINYKINLFRTAAVLFGLLELAAGLVLLLKDASYEVGSRAMAATIVGIIFHLLCNMAFIIVYLRFVCLKRVQNDQNHEGQSSSTSIRHKAIILFSALLSHRIYKLLHANLFRDQVPEKPRETVPSRKLIRSNSLGDEEAAILPPPSTLGTYTKKFEHPFLTYLQLTSLFMGTLPVLIGSALQIMDWTFLQMAMWGIDCLLVSIASLALSAWDLWVFTNLRHHEQHSEMSSQQEVNNTHQNLKVSADIDIKVEPAKPTPSPKRSTIRPKLSQRTQKAKEKEDLSMQGVRGGIKRECDQETMAKEEVLPHLKVFDDFDEKDDNVLNEKKTKKFSTKNLRRNKKVSSRHINATSHRRYEVCDDLYINFGADEGTHAPTLNATHLHSRRSASPNRSLQEESIQVGGDFQDQPPNFADISDIEQGIPEPINISLSSAEPPPA